MFSFNWIQCLGLSVALVIPELPALARSVPKEPVILTIFMHNDAGIPWETLRLAEEEASHVFREARIEIQWRNCPEASDGSDALQTKNCAEAVFPKHLHLRIAKRSIGLSPDVMGISFLSEGGSGCQADLFYEEMEALRERSNASLASILGYVAAHEIGHLLLGTNSHASQGIMRAVWEHDELVTASRGALFFSEKQFKRMRARLERFTAPAGVLRASDRQLQD